MKNIVFDLGRVLLNYQPLIWLKKKNYKHYNELFEIIFQNPLWIKLDEGTITREEFTEKLINEYPELALDIEEIMEKWIELLLPIENNIKLLSLLKEKGYSLYIISNFHLDAYNRFLKKQDWFTLFDGAIISAKEKLIKPDLRIYELLLERYHLNADECLFIDDSLNNINACKNVGMAGIHLPDHSKLEEELKERVEYFKSEDKLLEAQRISERTNFDIEMMKETGFCSGIENYSRHLSGLKPGQPPYTLLDYFGDDFLLIIDESHITVPQVGGMYAGDQSRKQTLVDYGFRLPSAKDNRPLSFEEFESKLDQVMFVSATPGQYEYDHELLRAEQIIRPTGLLDPKVEVRPIEGQIDDLIGEVNKEVSKKHKILITTLTKRMAEDLTEYMKEVGIRVRYLHSDIDTLERARIIRDMRLDVFDVLVGINLLREGLDIPEITLVAILDADKEGFLRSETSLIQTIGRAARNSEGHVIMYADNMTDSMHKAITETNRRRTIQEAYNKEHGITPTTIKKAVRDLIAVSKAVAETEVRLQKDPESMTRKELTKLIAQVEKQMRAAAADLNFEQAAELRDKMIDLKKNLDILDK